MPHQSMRAYCCGWSCGLRMAVKFGSGGNSPSSMRCWTAASCCRAATGRPGQWRIGPRSSPGSSKIFAERRPLTLRRSIIFVSTARGPCERKRQSVASTSGNRVVHVGRSRHQEKSRSRLRSIQFRAALLVSRVHSPVEVSYGSWHGNGGSGSGRAALRLVMRVGMLKRVRHADAPASSRRKSTRGDDTRDIARLHQEEPSTACWAKS